MLRTRAWGLAWVAVVAAAPAAAVDRSFTLGTSWGDVSYSSGNVEWLDSKTKRLQVGYDLGDVPVFFELGLQEASRSAYASCPGPVCAGIDYSQDFSAWQLAAGYRAWTHRRSGSALLLKAGLCDAELSYGTGPGPSSREFGDNGYFLGAAVTLMATPAVGLRLDWEYLNGLDAVERHDANVTMAGVIVKFGGYPQ